MDEWTSNWRIVDFVSGWFTKAAAYGLKCKSRSAFVATKSICQGRQVDALWKPLQSHGIEIFFAHTAFKWANLAANKAGVTVVIVGIEHAPSRERTLISLDDNGQSVARAVDNISAYLVAGPNVIVSPRSLPLSALSDMSFGNMPNNGGPLLLTPAEVNTLGLTPDQRDRFVRPFVGSAEFVRGTQRFCLWVEDEFVKEAYELPELRVRFEAVRLARLDSRDASARELAKRPHQFREMHVAKLQTISVPAISSENREYLPCGLLPYRTIVSNKIYALYDAPLWQLAILLSAIHLVWISSVCGRMRTDFSYSNTLGWNTFPVPTLTEQNRADLTRCAEDILLAREVHFPATIADLYDPETMPANLRAAHDTNDETLERIYIGRRFRNDTERLDKLVEMYAKMQGSESKGQALVKKTKVSRKTAEVGK